MATMRPLFCRAEALFARRCGAPTRVFTRAYRPRNLTHHPTRIQSLSIHAQKRAASTATEDNDKGNVWTVKEAAGTSYWDDYLATRPKYDERIFKPLVEHHTSNGGSFDKALDIGSGAGSAVEGLLKHFHHVVSSDNDPMSQEFTRKRFSDKTDSQLSYTLSKGEDLIQYHEPESFDLMTCAETFPLLDLQQAQKTILTLLKPGGTLAIWFYGPPFFIEGDDPAEATRIFQEIVDMNFKPVVSGRDPEGQKSWKLAADGMHSWLDYIPFPQDQWQNVHRHKWNTQVRLAFFGPAACDFPIEPKSSVAKGERTTEDRDDSLWQVNWDLNKLRQFVRASFPRSNWYEADQEFNPLFEKLRKAMGQDGAARPMSWPAVLVLAQKRA